MAKAKRVKKRVKKNIPTGVCHIQATFNNTLITITDVAGNVSHNILVSRFSRPSTEPVLRTCQSSALS